MFRKLFVLHRWFGIGGALMVLVWYASGIGLHWRALPRVLTPEEQRRAGGEAFGVAEVVRHFDDILAGTGTEPVREIQLRRAGSRLVYEVRTEGGGSRILDARTGKSLAPITESFAREIASTFMPNTPVRASVLMTQGDTYSSNLPMPLYRVTFDDHQGTHVYVSQNTASVLARARLPERLYFNFASIPHFLTFNSGFVRSHEKLRHAALYVLNTLAALLVITGLSVVLMMIWRSGFLEGIGRRQFLMRKWHYLVGVVFCVSTLLFVVSGYFLVVNGGTPPDAVLARPAELHAILEPMNADTPNIRPVPEVLAAHSDRLQKALTSVTLKSVLGLPVYVFQDREGRRHAVRADTNRPLSVNQSWARQMAEAFLGRPVAVGQMEYVTEYDSYYYARDKRFPPLPVYRMACDDPQETILYLSAATGEVVGRTDRTFRRRRWLVTALHTWDFPFLLNRPLLRDAVVMVQVVGGLVLTLTGLYLGGVHCLAWWRRRWTERRTLRATPTTVASSIRRVS